MPIDVFSKIEFQLPEEALAALKELAGVKEQTREIKQRFLLRVTRAVEKTLKDLDEKIEKEIQTNSIFC